MSDFYIPSEGDDEQRSSSSERPQDSSGDGVGDEQTRDTGNSGELPSRENELVAPPLPPAPPEFPPSSLDDFPDGLRNRIARVTREGGFGRTLPLTYDDPDADPPGEDWKSALSHDPFERLFLDWRQAGSISDQTVRQHGAAIAQFWEHKAKLLEQASTDIRGRILRTFGDRSRIKGFESQARDDADALATPEKRTDAVRARINTIRTRILARFEDFVLGDRTLSPNEAELLLAQADAEGWSRDEAAAFLLSELHQRSFRNEQGDEPTSEDDYSATFLLSSSWSAAAKNRKLTPEDVISAPLTILMLSGSITAVQIQSLLATAVEAGLDRETAAEFIAKRLHVHEGLWKPAPGEVSEKGSLADALSSVRWLSPKHYTEALRHLEEERRRTFEAEVDKVLSGKTLTPSKAKELLAASPLDQDEAAQTILGELGQRGFQPKRGRGLSGGTEATRLTSTSWSVPGKTRSLWPRVLVVWLAVCVLGVVLWLLTKPAPEPTEPTAIVDTQRLNVRSVPTDKGGDETIIGRVTLGEKLRVIGYTMNDAGETWLRIDYRGREGWLSDWHVQFTRYDDVVRLPAALSPQPVQDATDDTGSFTSGEDPGKNTPAPPEPAPDVIYPPTRLDTRPRLHGQVPVLKTPPGGYNGRVQVLLYLDRQGQVERSECQSNLSSDLCSRAENATTSLRFDPGRFNGQPVRTWTEIEIRFAAALPPPSPPPQLPLCAEEEIEALVLAQVDKASECAVLTDSNARRRCNNELDAIKARLKRCSN